MPVSHLSVAFASEGGVGPAMALVQRVLARGPSERVMMFYSTPDTEHSEPLEELLALKDRNLERFSLSFVANREPEEAELITGPLDADKVSALAGKLFDARTVKAYFVCGSASLVGEVKGALTKLGVESGRIHAEDVSAPPPAGEGNTVAALAAEAPPAATKAPQQAAAGKSPQLTPETRVELVMDGRRRAFTMLTGTESILDAASRAGIDLPFSCKAGVCSTCRTKLVRGEVALAQNYALEDWELEQGFILACQAHAKTPEIELTYDEK